ncbi:hypothetical protein RAS1_02130 [Phycisphaerae bacterium RAS1]|nr:hypothetical protein RAS1_02130 [Phycisphaerae bacterium RAS1]
MLRATPAAVLLIALLHLAVPAAALAQSPLRSPLRPPTARVPETRALLNQKMIDVSFGDASLEAAIDWLRSATGADFVVRWQPLEDAGVRRDTAVSLNVRNLPLSQVLWLLLTEAGGPDVRLAYRASGRLILISTEEDLDREMVTRVYDVSDLLFAAPRFRNAAQIDPTQALQAATQSGQSRPGSSGGSSSGGAIFNAGRGAEEGDDAARDDRAELVALIRQVIEPESWADGNAGGRGTIVAFRDALVIRSTLRVHQQIGGFLGDE